ncbi:unnamed protein product, partial [Adineta ricciae]
MTSNEVSVANVQLPITISSFTKHSIHLYILRSTTIDETFKIRAFLNNEYKYTFRRIESFNEQERTGPYIYRADVDLYLDTQDRPHIKLENGQVPIFSYRIRLSRKIPHSDTTFRDYNDDKERTFENLRTTVHYFLFDVHFTKNIVDAAPGSNVSFWSQLCLYTYYILRHQIYPTFRVLTEQFIRSAQEDKRKLVTADVNEIFQDCFTYSLYALSVEAREGVVNKIIICMMGILPIAKSNFDVKSHFTVNFTLAMTGTLREHFDKVFATVNQDEWPLFRDGLVLFMSIEFLIKAGDTMTLIHRMKNEQCKKDLANVLLQRLEELQRPIIGLNWTDLFALVDQNILTLKQIELTESIPIYITSLIQILEIEKNSSTLQDQVIRQFDNLIFESRLSVNLDSIIFLLNFSQVDTAESSEVEKEILLVVNRAIESSIQLRARIKDYLYSLTITTQHFRDIHLIVSSISKSIILYLIKKRDLLMHLFSHAHTSYSYEFFKQWCLSFLIFDDPINDQNNQDYKDLLKQWLNQVNRNPDIKMKIIMDVDTFINAFVNEHHYRLIFIEHMITFCFQQASIYTVISGSLIHVRNELFLNQFRKYFASTQLVISQEKLKQLQNPLNPLYHLIRIYTQVKGQSALINELIQLTSRQIKFEVNEILRDTFERPTRTACVYAVLFDNCFENTTLRQMIIDQLLALWNSWEEEGFRANQLQNWKKFTNEERQIVKRIWDYVGEKAEKQYQIDSLIDRQGREMEEKIQIKEKIIKCLEIYCEHACDKEIFFNLLAEIDDQLRSRVVRSIRISEEIQTLVPLAERLNPLEKLHAWQTFLAKHQKIAARNRSSPTTTDSASSCASDDETLSPDERTTLDKEAITNDLPSSPPPIRSNSRNYFAVDRRTCIEILTECIDILDIFGDCLKTICSNWTRLPLSELLNFFPDLQYIDHDFAILKPLLQPDISDKLKSILDYWKNREHIHHICRGYINLISNLQKPADTLCEHLRKITELHHKSQCFKCWTHYQYYLSKFSAQCSKEFLDFLSQYSVSYDLIAFLNLLPSTDVDNLLQAVNDWDEILINTRTVLDFVMLKRFFVLFNQEISPTDATIEQAQAAFLKIFENEQFKSLNLFSCFQTCSASLPSIKRIHLELTDKELSKRTHISDLMRKITFHFTVQANRFDIDVQPQSMGFSDLSELRDRARLIEYSTNKKNQFLVDVDRDIKERRAFVEFVETVEKILKNFSSLNIAGHPSVVDYLAPNRSFTCVNCNYQELTEFSIQLDTLLESWQTDLCQMYEKHLDLTYFSHQQIWVIEDYLYNRTEPLTTKHAGYHLLKYIGIEPNTIRSEYLPVKGNNPTERLKNIGKILTAQRTKMDLSVKQESINIKKVYVAETSNEGILRTILSLFKITETPCLVNHLFYCAEETSWMEMRAFAYRCFYSQQLHQLIRPELLSSSIQDRFTRLIKQFMEENPQRYFRLGLITTVSSTHLQLINGLRTLQIVLTIHDQDMLNELGLKEIIQKSIDENCTLVTSRINGLGKTSLIQNEIRKKGKIYIKFPISGDIDVDNIAERLCNYGNQLTSARAALHIDIGAINNMKQLNELLYCLLLFRGFRFKQIAVYVPIDIPIYIELDSSPAPIDIREKVVLLKFIKTNHIEHIDWNTFRIHDPSAVRLIIRYLQAIDDGTIREHCITEDPNIDIDLLKGINRLKATFLLGKDLEYITWTKLSIFISVYYRLFSGFSRCGYFFPDLIPEPQLRLDILQSFLKSSNQFTSMCVERVRKNQRSVSTNDAAVSFSEAIVSWDDTEPFTVVFSATNDPLFIYKQPTDVPQSL